MMRYLPLLLALLAAGCESKTEFGQCLGIDDNKDESLEYRISTRNIVVGIILVETVVVPVVVALDQTYCPIARKVKP